MSGEFLSQDEVDALLEGAQADEAGTPAGVSAAADQAQPYDLARQQRIERGRMPALERIHARFVRDLGAALSAFVRRKTLVGASATCVQRYDDFLRQPGAPASFNLLQVTPLRGRALLVCEPQLVFALVDAMFGGDGRGQAQLGERAFSATEQRIVERMIGVVCNTYRNAWSGIYPLELEFLRSESQARFADVAAPAAMVISLRLDIDLAGAGGALHLCIPWATLEPVREALQPGEAAEPAAPDRRWVARLSQQIKSAEVELVAELGHARASVADLVALKAGDFIELDLGKTLLATVDKVPVFECRYGISNGRYAIKVQSFLTGNSDNPKGAIHGDR